MIVIIPSAKTFCEPNVHIQHVKMQQLLFSNEYEELLQIVKKLTVNDIQALMKLSDDLASKTYEQYENYYNQVEFPAITGFYGAMYKAIESQLLTVSEQSHLQEVVRILSGLYGMLRPFDFIRQYRLEMATSLENRCGQNLYNFWRDRLTNELLKEIEKSPGEKVLINLSSGEYSKAIQMATIRQDYPVIEILFKEKREQSYKLIGTYAKTARGLMIQYIAKNQVTSVEELKQFNVAGYIWNEELSTTTKLVFTREGKEKGE